MRTSVGSLFTILVSVAGASLTGCEASPPAACPDQYDFGVVWSSPSQKKSVIQLLSGGVVTASINVPVQGMTLSDETPRYIGDDVVLIAESSAIGGETNVVRFEPAICKARVVRIPFPAPLNMDADAERIVATNWMEGVARVEQFDWNGKSQGAVEIPGQTAQALNIDGGTLFVAVTVDSDRTSSIRVFDLPGLAERSDISLPGFGTGSVSGLAEAGGRLFIPNSFDVNDSPDTRLGVVDLGSRSVRMIELDSRLPYYVQARDGKVYVAHTSINPGLGAMSDYRRLSVVDATTEAVTGYDLKDGISKFSLGPRALAVIGEDSDENVILHTYDQVTMNPLSRTRLSAPSDVPDAYAANVFVAQT